MAKSVNDLIKERDALDAAIAAATAREKSLTDCFSQIDQMLEENRITVDDIAVRYFKGLRGKPQQEAVTPKVKTQKAKKFRNPNDRSMEWAGVGKSIPIWFKRNVEAGVMPWDMLIDKSEFSVQQCKAWYANPNTKARLTQKK